MKTKKSLIVLLLLFVFTASLIFVSGCQKAPDAPQGLKLTKEYLEWTAVEGAQKYQFSVDGRNYVDVETNKVLISDHVTSADVTKLYVRAVNGNAVSKPETIDVTAVKLSAPEKPELKIDEVTHLPYFSWSEVEDATKYLVSINDKNWITYKKNTYNPTTTNTYTIKVKAAADITGNKIYIASDASQESDTLDFIAGPALSNPKINVINWESAEEFDSFNLWVDGEKVRENVVSPLDLVAGDDPVLTKTGEYDIQIEAIRADKSAWSNICEDLGTSNINDNEIYSFDNRVMRLTSPKDPTKIYYTDEKYHGDSGYSLKMVGAEQINLIRYDGSDINSFDFRNITAISYWVYVESVSDYEYDYVTSNNVPGVKIDEPNTTFFADPMEIKIGEWTKVVVPCINENEIVLILCQHNWEGFWEDGKTHEVVLYIDDIRAESFDVDIVDDYDYELKYDVPAVRNGSWYGSLTTALDFGNEYANKNVKISGQIAGTVNPDMQNPVGFSYFKTDSSKGGDNFLGNITIDLAKLSSSTWTDFDFDITLDESGKCYLSPMCWGNDGRESYYVYLKDLTVEDLGDLMFTKPNDGSWWNDKGPKTIVSAGIENAGKTVYFTALCKTNVPAGDKDQNPFEFGLITNDLEQKIWIENTANAADYTSFKKIICYGILDANGDLVVKAYDYNKATVPFNIYIDNVEYSLVDMKFAGPTGGNWWNDNDEKAVVSLGAENADKSVTITAKLYTDVVSKNNEGVLVDYNFGFAKGGDVVWTDSTANANDYREFKEISFTTTLDANGDLKLKAHAQDGTNFNDKFSILLKEISYTINE